MHAPAKSGKQKIIKRAATVIKPDKDAIQIGDLYRKARLSLVESVRFAITCGQRLKTKQDSLPHGAWLPWLRNNADVLGFDTPRTAQRLMALAANTTLASHLNETTAITYSRQLWGHDDDDDDDDRDDDRDDVDLDSLLRNDDGKLTPQARQFIREVKAENNAAKKAIRDAREIALAGKILALPDIKAGAILADPEWRFEPWSRETGLDMSADNHYQTSPLADIMARDVASIAADDCVLFLCATIPMMPQQVQVMESPAWGGFKYKSHWAWDKGDGGGTGYWIKEEHELLLVGTRGNIPAPAPGTQWPSVIRAPRGSTHSEKPEKYYELIEAYYPNVPKIELNARKARKGWMRWGFEAPPLDEAAE